PAGPPASTPPPLPPRRRAPRAGRGGRARLRDRPPRCPRLGLARRSRPTGRGRRAPGGLRAGRGQARRRPADAAPRLPSAPAAIGERGDPPSVLRDLRVVVLRPPFHPPGLPSRRVRARPVVPPHA